MCKVKSVKAEYALVFEASVIDGAWISFCAPTSFGRENGASLFYR